MMEQFDVYCERTDFSFWSEPVNALTNLAFLIAAILAFAMRPRDRGEDWLALFLIVVVAIVGIGSFLFHTFATRWASLTDTLPITLFIYGFFLIAMRRLLGLSPIASIIATILFFLAARYGAPPLRPIAGYSAGYVPPLIGLAVVGVVLAVRRLPGAVHLLCAAALFAVSLLFRIIDEPVCASFPLGTHFLWHVINAIVLFILIQVIVQGRPVLNKRKTS